MSMDTLAQLGVKNLLNHKWFDLCRLDALLTATGNIRQQQTAKYALLRSIHCMDYSAMTDLEREAVHNAVFDLLGLTSPEQIIEHNPSEKHSVSLFTRALSLVR